MMLPQRLELLVVSPQIDAPLELRPLLDHSVGWVNLPIGVDANYFHAYQPSLSVFILLEFFPWLTSSYHQTLNITLSNTFTSDRF